MSQTKNTFVGIDIGTYTTRVVVCENNPNQNTLKVIGSGQSPTSGLKHGYVINKNQAAKSLKKALIDAEKSFGKNIKKAYLSIGGISLQSVIVKNGLTLPKDKTEITETEIDYLFNSAEKTFTNKMPNRQILSSYALDYRIDGQETFGEPVGMKGSRLDSKIVILSLLEHHYIDLIEVVESCGIQIEDIVPSAIAMGSVALDSRQKVVGSLLLDIGSETTTLGVFQNNVLMSLEVFPFGSSHITNDIALGFRVPLEEAEKMKRDAQDTLSISKKKVENIANSRLADIFELTKEHLKTINRTRLLPGGIMIAGGGSSLTSLEDFAKSTLEMPAKLVHLDNISSTRKYLTDSSWLVAYGACYYALLNEKKDNKNSGFSLVLLKIKDLFNNIGKSIKSHLPVL